ncbi:Gfo/Idh/MocA family oxidoreductase [Streptomyces sp. JB150]|uniref:Gfo/Idh/MocA family protein n=1 Tax=Streptomyces sp. JB150 TaxID=2714844 RepID=UPI00140B583C|nr:Gfo/Idh/MocA family oxidoreductase [Streptomyces sp. JB150]QIJ66058.1 Gfo/Idh/MocA family oxidoreductase [Streptomyces sp. JB150]
MRWGIAGYGDVVERRVLPAMRLLGHVPLFVCGRDAGRARASATRWGIPASGTDPRDLLTGVDAVYVATPVVGHVPLARQVLEAGLPVLVEKPLAGSLPVDSSPVTGAGCRAGVAYYRRLAPVVRRLRSELTGWTPERVDVRFRCAFAPGPGHPMRWRTDPAVSGGGVLADAGSHRLDLLLMLWGRPVRVRARLDRRFPAGAERRAELELDWPGTRAHCLFEWDDAPPADRLALYGPDRCLVLDPLDRGELTVTGPGGVRRETHPPHGNPHVPLLADFAAAVREGRPPVCPAAEGALVDDVIRAAERSAALGGAPVRPGQD